MMLVYTLAISVSTFWIGYKYGRRVEKWNKNQNNNGSY